MPKIIFTREMEKWLMRILISLALILMTAGGCTWVNKKLNLDDDHAAEEFVERVIENETGLSVDLTPNSPENRD